MVLEQLVHWLRLSSIQRALRDVNWNEVTRLLLQKSNLSLLESIRVKLFVWQLTWFAATNTVMTLNCLTCIHKSWYSLSKFKNSTLFLLKSTMKELWQVKELWRPLNELDEKEPSLKYSEKSNVQSCPLTCKKNSMFTCDKPMKLVHYILACCFKISNKK